MQAFLTQKHASIDLAVAVAPGAGAGEVAEVPEAALGPALGQ